MKSFLKLAIVALATMVSVAVSATEKVKDAVVAGAQRAHDTLFDYMGRVGMLAFAVVNLKSTAITNATATPMVPNSANIANGNLRESQGFAVIANGDSATSTYRLGRIRSGDRMSEIKVYSPDIGTTTAGDLGLYDKSDVNAGAVVDVDFFASALSLSGGALNGVDITFEAAAAGGLITNGEKRIWEALGLSADPHNEYDVVLTLTGAADAAGTALFRWRFVSGE
jgi:hypothetical protein